MLTLSKGFKKPQDGDKGSVFFDALADNIQQLNDHDHNGSNSPQIAAYSIATLSQTISSSGWVAISGNKGWKQTVTLTAGLQYDDVTPSFRDSSTGHILQLGVEKVSATSYDVFINDNTISLKAIYR